MKYSHKTITSLSNPLIKEALKIKNGLGRQRGFFLIEGSHLIETAAFSSLAVIKRVFFTEIFASKKDSQRILDQIPGIEKVLITERILSSLTDTDMPQGISALINYTPPKLEEIKAANNPLFVLCDSIQDPGNVGTIIRGADVFGADAVITFPFTCDPLNTKAIRATAGSLFNIPVINAEQNELLSYLALKNIALYATSSKAVTSIHQIDLKQPVAIVFGNESSGVSNPLQEKAKEVFKIPISGNAESLNVAMAASVCLYEAARQRNFLHIPKIQR